MTVTFGTVQLIPATESPAAASHEPAPPAGQAPPPDPKDLRPALQKLHERARRLRAH
jgi:hypothetical protein